MIRNGYNLRTARLKVRATRVLVDWRVDHWGSVS